jgi:hypothetical protein
VRGDEIAGCEVCGGVYHLGCARSLELACPECRGRLLVGESPPPTGDYRLPRHVREIAGHEGRVAELERAWAEGLLARGEYERLLAVLEEERRT